MYFSLVISLFFFINFNFPFFSIFPFNYLTFIVNLHEWTLELPLTWSNMLDTFVILKPRQSHLCVSWKHPRSNKFRHEHSPLATTKIQPYRKSNQFPDLCECFARTFAAVAPRLQRFGLERARKTLECTLLNKKCCIRSGTKREKLKFTMKRKSCSYTRPLPLCAHRNGKLNMRSLRTSASCWCSFPIQSSESLRIISSSPTHGLLCYRIEAQCLTCHLITQSRPEVIRSRGENVE